MTFIRGGNANTNIPPFSSDVSRAAPALTTNGSAGGNFNMAVDGSVTPAEFYSDFTAFSGVASELYLQNMYIAITTKNNEAFNFYGTLSALTNGTTGFYEINGVETPLFFPSAGLKKNADFYIPGRMVNISQFQYNLNQTSGFSDHTVLWFLDWTVNNADRGIRFDITQPNTRMGLRVNDDLTGLEFHAAYITLLLEVGS